MTTYTRSGLVVNVLAESEKLIRGAYQDEAVDTILAYIKSNHPLSFEQEKKAILRATTIWVETGGIFNKQLVGANLTLNARSFIAETAALLTGQIKTRRVSFPDWRLLLCPGDSVVLHAANWTADELEDLQVLRSTPTPVLIQRWVSEHGVGDLVQTLGVFVSPSI